MFTRVCLSLALLVSLPAFSQVDTYATEGGVDVTDQARMLTPPPVSGASYPTAVGSEERSNYLRAGLIFNGAHSDNAFENIEGRPISDFIYSFWPTIAIDKVTSRMHLVLTYAPGFTLYQRTTSADQTDQNLSLDFRFRWTPHITVSVQDFLLKASNVLNQPNLLSAGAISGSGEPPPIAVIVPVANQLSNTANMALTYQFSRNGMIGGGGTFTNLDYSNPAQVPGLYNSSSRGGSAFYSHRLSRKQYVGATYRYSEISAFPINTPAEVIQTNTFSFFYTVYLKPTLSFSLLVGPQHVDVTQPPSPAYRSWSPAATASVSWQERHTNLAASYLRLVTGGAGLLGAFQTNSAAASARWRLARTWNVGSVASYAIYENITPSYFLATPGGHSIYGTVSVQHLLTARLSAELGYTRLDQSYSGIAVISNAPNTNREYISLSYQFARPLGR